MLNKLFSRLLVTVLPAGFVAIMLAGPGTLIISLIAPDFLRVTEKVVCPQGKGQILWRDNSYGSTRSTEMLMYCLDAEGVRSKETVTLPAIGLLFGVYFVVLAPLSLFLLSHQGLGTLAGTTAMRPAGALIDSQVRDLIARGQTVEAIRLVREATGVGLTEAKVYVARLGRAEVARFTDEGKAVTTGANAEGQVAKLRELKQMLEEGLITPAEYETKKREILSEL